MHANGACHFSRSYFMQGNTTINFTSTNGLNDREHTWSQAVTTLKKSTEPKFPPDEDIELWLKHDAPTSFQQLADLRYVLYHNCTRNEFLVAHVSDETFSLT